MIISVQLAHYLEKYIEIVTILSGGILEGPNAELDLLSESSQARVIRGVRTFKNTNSDKLVMQERLSGLQPEKMTNLMKELTVEMGVLKDNIITESIQKISSIILLNC